MLALYTGLTRISDYRHHPSDVAVGLLQGALVAYWVVSWRPAPLCPVGSFSTYVWLPLGGRLCVVGRVGLTKQILAGASAGSSRPGYEDVKQPSGLLV